jgi:hypothetical protein
LTEAVFRCQALDFVEFVRVVKVVKALLKSLGRI